MQHAQVIPIESKRLARMQRSAMFQHLSAGVVLAEAGYDALRKHPGEDLLLSWFSLLSGVVLVIAVVIELRHLRQLRQQRRQQNASGAPVHAHGSGAEAGGFSWMDIVAVPALIAEGWHRAHRGAHYLPYVYFGLAAFTLLRALILDRLIGSPRATIDAERIVVRRTPFHKQSAAWADVVGLTRVAKGVELQLAPSSSEKEGSRVMLTLDDAMNRDVVEQAIVKAWTTIAASRMPPVPPVPDNPSAASTLKPGVEASA